MLLQKTFQHIQFSTSKKWNRNCRQAVVNAWDTAIKFYLWPKQIHVTNLLTKTKSCFLKPKQNTSLKSNSNFRNISCFSYFYCAKANIICLVVVLLRDIHIECSKQFKWNLYFYVSGQSRPFLAALKLL